MQVRDSVSPARVKNGDWVAFPSWIKRPAQPYLFLGFLEQQNRSPLACLGGGITEYTKATDTSGSLRPTALHKTSGLTTDRQRNLEAGRAPGLQCHYLSCFLGRVLLQNLGLAAGEERGLEVQTGRKQEKEY